MNLNFKENPLVTVLLPVFNAEKYLQDALESILQQTYKNITILAIDDGSTDKSLEILRAANNKDSRLIIITRENRGLVSTLNEGLVLAEGEFIARMDADDISLPTRIEKQVALMQQHSDIGVCGCHYSLMGESNQKIYVQTKHEYIAAQLLFGVPLAHPSAMLRKSLLDEKGIQYNPEFQRAQDYELWSRMVKYTKFASVDEILFYYRIHQSQASVVETSITLGGHIKITRKILNELDIDLTDDEILAFIGKSEAVPLEFLQKLYKQVTILNNKKNIFDSVALHTILAKRLLFIAAKLGGISGIYKVKRDPIFSKYIHIEPHIFWRALKKSIRLKVKV